jgi:hypothetical protein
MSSRDQYICFLQSKASPENLDLLHWIMHAHRAARLSQREELSSSHHKDNDTSDTATLRLENCRSCPRWSTDPENICSAMDTWKQPRCCLDEMENEGKGKVQENVADTFWPVSLAHFRRWTDGVHSAFGLSTRRLGKALKCHGLLVFAHVSRSDATRGVCCDLWGHLGWEAVSDSMSATGTRQWAMSLWQEGSSGESSNCSVHGRSCAFGSYRIHTVFSSVLLRIIKFGYVSDKWDVMIRNEAYSGFMHGSISYAWDKVISPL